MRFLMLNWRDPMNPRTGGAERVTKAFLAALMKRGHQVYWFANCFPGCKSKETVDDIEVVRGGGQGSSIIAAYRWHRQQKPFDLIIDQHHGIPWYAPWWSGTRCVAYIHEVLGPIWNAFYKWPWNVIGRTQESWTHKLYRNVPFFVPSNSTRVALHRHGVRSVKVLPNGVDTAPLEQLGPKDLTCPLRLAAVSRLAPNKRVDHAILAAKLLHERGIQAELTVVGSGEVEDQLRRLVKELQLAGIRFTGAVPETVKNKELERAHILVHTSLREGWGLNVIEANAMGTPAVVYPVDGLVDSTVHGETGLLSRQETPESLVETILGLLNNPAEYSRLRQNCWERSKKFQWPVVLPLTCDWLEEQARRPLKPR